MVERTACFLTCGYTEAGAMQLFVHKINDRYEFRQYLPNKTIKKKGMPKNISDAINGLTGDRLLEEIYKILGKHKAEINNCKAIIVEDDLDGRFFNWTEDKITQYTTNVISKIQTLLGNKLPVFVIYASPEIESWFISDWKNSFEYVYSSNDFIHDIERNARLFYTHHLKTYIFQNILKQYASDIENYGYFEGIYYKLSDQIKDAIQFNVKDYIIELPVGNDNYKNQISNSKNLYYSKRIHGDKMLRNISPVIVANNCKKYFNPLYYLLHKF